VAGNLDGVLPEPSPRTSVKSARWLGVFPALGAVWLFLPFSLALLEGKETEADCEVTITQRRYNSSYGYGRRRNRYGSDYDRDVTCAYFAEGSMRSFRLWAYSREGRFRTPVRYVEGKADWSAAPEFLGEQLAWIFLFVFLALFWHSWADTLVPWVERAYRPRR
jgi:hypothetical protein